MASSLLLGWLIFGFVVIGVVDSVHQNKSFSPEALLYRSELDSPYSKLKFLDHYGTKPLSADETRKETASELSLEPTHFQDCYFMCKCSSTYADCSHNYGELTFIPKLPPGTLALNFSFNNLTAITTEDFFHNVTDLTVLDLRSNGLVNASTVAFTVFTRLQYLSLSRNALTFSALSFISAVPTLRYLEVIGGNLGPVPSGFFHQHPLPRLEILNLHFNQLQRLNFSDFTPLIRLRHLGLGFCQIANVTLDYMPRLDVLVLHSNKFTHLPPTCDASYNQSYFPGLTKLYLDDNSILSLLDVDVCLPELRHLDLSRNRLVKIFPNTFNADQFPKLELLFLRSNVLTITNIYPNAFTNPSLLMISLLNNKLHFFDDRIVHPDAFLGCEKLFDLQLDGNTFLHTTDVKFQLLFGRLPKLRNLIMSFTEITKITSNTFRSMPELEMLYLSGNALVSIPDGAFDHQRNLSMLFLNQNGLSQIGEGTFSERTRANLRRLDLSGNPFTCSCDILFLRNWLRTDPQLFAHSHGSYQCRNLDNEDVKSYDLDKQACVWSHETYVFVTISLSLFLLILSILVLIYRCRWHIRLLLYESAVGKSDRRRRHLMGDHFRYDLFIAYAEEDHHRVNEVLVPELEGRLGLRLCLHQRDFIPGEPIVHSIACSVESSKKVMMIFSANFARSEWCQFELSLCLRYALDHDDLPLVVCLHQLTSRDLTTAMWAVIKTTVYIQWEDEPDAHASFWGRLHIALNEIVNGRLPEQL